MGAKLVRNLTGSFSHCQFSECNQKRPQSSQTSHNLVGILSDKYDNKVTFWMQMKSGKNLFALAFRPRSRRNTWKTETNTVFNSNIDTIQKNSRRTKRRERLTTCQRSDTKDNTWHRPSSSVFEFQKVGHVLPYIKKNSYAYAYKFAHVYFLFTARVFWTWQFLCF